MGDPTWQLGGLVRAFRDRFHLSKAKAAKVLGVSILYVRSLEEGVDVKTGLPFRPREATLRQMATRMTEFGYPVSYEAMAALIGRPVLTVTPDPQAGWRNVQVATRPPLPADRELPYYGQVGCGEPVSLTGDPLDTVELAGLVPRADEVLVLACGDSMDRLGIVDGVYLTVRSARTATTGDVVIANLAGEGCTCKRLRIRRQGRQLEHWLLPESTNPAHVPRKLEAADFIVGVVTGILCRF